MESGAESRVQYIVILFSGQKTVSIEQTSPKPGPTSPENTHIKTTIQQSNKKQSRTKQGRDNLLHIGKLIKLKYTQVKLIRQNQQTNEKGIGSG